MAADSKFPAWCVVFILVFLPVSLAVSSASSRAEGKVRSLRDIFRSRRQTCPSGTYDHDGVTCCLCAAGQYLKEHCTKDQPHPTCEYCDTDTYSSHPNSQETCEPCTSCSQANANLEVEDSCTIARDTKCRCKKDHYCSTGTCKICNPCKECGSAGIKEACTATSDTVCKDGGPDIGKIIGIVLGVGVGVFFVVICAVYWRKKQQRQRPEPPHDINGVGADMELQPLRAVDLQPLLPDIAEQLEWKDMRDVAMRSGMTNAVIESCKLDNQGDSQEQTLQLLKRWVEMQGRDASKILVQSLQNSGKKAKAERVFDILSRANPAGINAPA